MNNLNLAPFGSFGFPFGFSTLDCADERVSAKTDRGHVRQD